MQTKDWQQKNSKILIESDRHQAGRSVNCLPSDLQVLLQAAIPDDSLALQELLSLYSGDLLEGLSGLEPELASWVDYQRGVIRQRFINLVIEGARKVGGLEAERALEDISARYPDREDIFREYLSCLSIRHDRAFLDATAKKYVAHIRTQLQCEPEPETAQLIATLTTRLYPALSEKPTPQPISDGLPRVLLLPPKFLQFDLGRQREQLALSLVQDVTITLCRMRSFRMYAPHTAHQWLSAGVPVNAPVDYLAATSIFPGKDNEFRLGISLTRVADSLVLFGDEIRVSEDTVSDRHAQLASTLANALATNVERSELAIFRRTGNSSAYVHFLLGIEQLKIVELKNLRRARSHFQRAADLARDFAPASSMVARTLTLEWLLLGRQDREILHAASDIAGKAIAIDPLDAFGYRELGHAALYMHQLEDSERYLSSALERAPHNADILVNYADALIHNSSSKRKAKTLMDEAFGLNPLAPDQYYWVAATAEFFLGHYREALETVKKMQHPQPATRFMSACAALLGDMDEAHRYRDISLSRQPDFRLHDWKALMPLKSEADKDHFVEALKLAGFR